MLKTLIWLQALVVSANSIHCLTCDDETPCSAPFPIECAPNSRCYTVVNKDSKEVITKGCAHSCSNVPVKTNQNCTECNHRDFCNGKPLGIGKDVDVHFESLSKDKKFEISGTEMAERGPLGHGYLTTPESVASCSWWEFWCSGASGAFGSFGFSAMVSVLVYVLAGI